MTESKKTSVPASAGGVGFSGALTLLFVGLKLTGHIGWSWVWVLSPLWGAVALFLAVALVVVAGAAWLVHKGKA